MYNITVFASKVYDDARAVINILTQYNTDTNVEYVLCADPDGIFRVRMTINPAPKTK